MGNAEQTQEAILAATEALILESGGDADHVTIRQIAARAGVSVGLINHYYASKELLLEACVQQMIGGVIGAFQPDLSAVANKAERLGRVAGQVAEFLAEHPQISRISILGDLQRPNAADNTMASVRGFSYTIAGGTQDAEAKLRAFCLTAILQVAFLRKESMLETVGLDFNDKQQRDAFLLRAAEWVMKDET